MTREEAENRINDLAWQIRDVILEYNPKETYFTLNFGEGTAGEAFSWLSYWNLCSYKEDGSNKPLDNHCPIPNEEMIRYRESLSTDRTGMGIEKLRLKEVLPLFETSVPIKTIMGRNEVSVDDNKEAIVEFVSPGYYAATIYLKEEEHDPES